MSAKPYQLIELLWSGRYTRDGAYLRVRSFVYREKRDKAAGLSRAEIVEVRNSPADPWQPFSGSQPVNEEGK